MPALMGQLNAIARCSNQYRNEKLEPLGLKSVHASYILHICADPGISQEQLARRIYINKSNVARQLATLEENGFVQRTPCPSDRRILRLYPTEKALQVLPEIKRILTEWETLVTAGCDPEMLTNVIQFLRQLKENAAAQLQQE